MNIVPADEQRGYMGQYSNDCYWKCIVYMKEGTTDPAIVEAYARSYYMRAYETSEPHAHSALEAQGAGMAFNDAYYYAMSEGLKDILFVNPDNVSFYRGQGIESISGAGHYIIIESIDYNNNIVYVFDPEDGSHFTMSAWEISDANGSLWIR